MVAAVWSVCCGLMVLTAGCCLLCQAEDDHDPSSLINGQDRKPEMPFRISRVEKSEAEDVFLIKVRYEGDTKPITVMRHNSPVREEVEQHLQGLAEFTIPKDPVRTYALLYFILPEQYLIMRMTLTDNSPDSVDIPPLHFNVLQGKDVQFSHGEEDDVKLNFTFDVWGDNSSVRNLRIQTRVMIRSESQDDVLDRYSDFSRHFVKEAAPVRVDLIEDELSQGHEYGQAVVNSTIENVEGIVELAYKLSLNCSPNCLVEDLRDVYRVRFYQDAHEGPFPKDFLGFVHDDFIVDNSHVYCEVDEPVCILICRAYGKDLTGITIRNMTYLDENIHTSEVNLTYGDWANSRLFLTKPSFKDSGEFLCTVKSKTGEIRKRITMDVVKRARIDMERSHVVKYTNGSALFVCVAEGNPSPQVKFDVEPITDQPIILPPIHVTHPSQSETRADLVVSDPDIISNLYGSYCLASNVRNYIFSHDDSHFLSLH